MAILLADSFFTASLNTVKYNKTSFKLMGMFFLFWLLEWIKFV